MGYKSLISLVLLVSFTSFWAFAQSADEDAVMLEIIDGDTAFMVNEKTETAYWVVGECRVKLPIKPVNSSENPNNSMTSEIISKNVRLGSRQIDLRQQFRFNVTTLPASVEVYNSVRGGWSSVPVRVNQTCTTNAACRRRMGLPEC